MIKSILFLVLFSVGFTSSNNNELRWGQNGHRTTGHIAQQYLSENAAKEVKRVLGYQSLAEVSTWMDEVKSDESYDYMSTWHYVTIPEGETYETAEQDEGGDIIWAIEKVVSELREGGLSSEEEAENLKILVHLVGDIHQPLHVGLGTDRGGNDVRLQWFWENSNLHRVWDSEMIDGKQLSFTELSSFLNHPSEDEIKEWQNSTVLDWAADSQSYLAQVYDIPDDKRLSYEYAYNNWDAVQDRLLKAGIRLAGVINDIYQ